MVSVHSARRVGVGFEHLAGIGPEAVERGLGAGVAFVGAVAEADQPGVGVAAVIGGLGEGFGGDGGEALVGMGVGGAGGGAPGEVGEGGIEGLADDGVGEVAVGLLDEEEVAEVGGVAVVGEVVFGDAGADAGGGVLVEQAGLADEVEGDVGEGEFFFQRRGVADPLGEAVAEDQGVVGAGAGWDRRRGWWGSHVPDLVGDVVEGRVAVDFGGGGFEEGGFVGGVGGGDGG